MISIKSFGQRLCLAVLLLAAFMSAANARYLTPDWFDPTQPSVGTNRYAYAGNNPVAHKDPSGNAWIDEGWDALFGEGSFDRTFGEGSSAWMDEAARHMNDGFRNGAGILPGTNDVPVLGDLVPDLEETTDGIRDTVEKTASGQYKDAAIAGSLAAAGMIPGVRKIIDEKRLNHIFRDSDGHLPDTPQNRRLLEDTANSPSNNLGTDQFGNEWSAQTLDDGSQVWTQSRGGSIINGGLNSSPRQFNPQTGLSSPTKPGQK